MEPFVIEEARHGSAMEPTSVGSGLLWVGMEAMWSEEGRRGSHTQSIWIGMGSMVIGLARLGLQMESLWIWVEPSWSEKGSAWVGNGTDIDRD